MRRNTDPTLNKGDTLKQTAISLALLAVAACTVSPEQERPTFPQTATTTTDPYDYIRPHIVGSEEFLRKNHQNAYAIGAHDDYQEVVIHPLQGERFRKGVGTKVRSWCKDLILDENRLTKDVAVVPDLSYNMDPGGTHVYTIYQPYDGSKPTVKKWTEGGATFNMSVNGRLTALVYDIDTRGGPAGLFASYPSEANYPDLTEDHYGAYPCPTFDIAWSPDAELTKNPVPGQ